MSIRVFLTKLVLLAVAAIAQSRWLLWYQDFEFWLIDFSWLADHNVVVSDLCVPYALTIQRAWRYLKKIPRRWWEDYDLEDGIEEDETEEGVAWDEADDEYAAVRLLAHTIFTPEFREAIKEHPEWVKFLI